MVSKVKNKRKKILILTVCIVASLILFSIYFFFLRGILVGYGPAPAQNISGISLPKGFEIEYYAQNVTGARSLAIADQTAVFVSTREQGVVYALRDFNRDGSAEKIFTIASNLDKPNGIAFDGHDLYITTTSKVYMLKDIVQHTGLLPPLRTIADNLSHSGGHDWRYTAFGPDGKLYIGMGAPCNVCDEQDPYASIARMNKDGTGFEVYARGIRNTVGFDWDNNGVLWFTDNGRDWLGDDAPGDELNFARSKDMHFGFPYCHQGDLSDPNFGDEAPCRNYSPPALVLDAHVAALGMTFANSDKFPKHYQEGIFIAEHGSWNRKVPSGYRIMFVPFKDGQPVGYEVFAQGWLQGNTAWGRPVDVAFLPDGSMLVSDDKAHSIYRITYTG